MPFSEDDFIAWATAGTGRAGLRVGPGDDAAVLADGVVLCVDAVVEGTHFESGTPLDLVARKALGSCLSDVAAMGALPECVLVSAQVPPGLDGRTLAEALGAWAEALEVVLAGGDTVSTRPGALALAVTALGRLDGHEPWLRSGGAAGDRLLVSGPLGGARAGRHLAVRPRFDVVRQLRAAEVPVHACLDLSDGLARDLPRMCRASGVGATVSAEALPIHADAGGASDPLLAALADGEDFELLLALPEGAAVPHGLLTPIGRLLPDGGPRLVRDGATVPWPLPAYEHAF